MFKIRIFLLLIIFYSCQANSSSPLETFMEAYGKGCKEMLIINWDQCPSCRVLYPSLIDEYANREDVIILVVSNTEKKIRHLIAAKNVKFTPVEDIIELDIYPSLPVIYSIHNNQIIGQREIDISIY